MPRSDISDVEYRLDKEGKDYHHHEGFAQLYRAEVLAKKTTISFTKTTFEDIIDDKLYLISLLFFRYYFLSSSVRCWQPEILHSLESVKHMFFNRGVCGASRKF